MVTLTQKKLPILKNWLHRVRTFNRLHNQDWQSTLKFGNHLIATKPKVRNNKIKDGPKRKRTGNVKTDLACTGRERLENLRIWNQRTNMRIVKFAAGASRKEGASTFICQQLHAGKSLSGEIALISRRAVRPRSQTTVVVLQSPVNRIKV